jgi:hypothetical protein
MMHSAAGIVEVRKLLSKIKLDTPLRRVPRGYVEMLVVKTPLSQYT